MFEILIYCYKNNENECHFLSEIKKKLSWYMSHWFISFQSIVCVNLNNWIWINCYKIKEFNWIIMEVQKYSFEILHTILINHR